jgi:DNA-binding CsgD family transcriptional regulator
MTGNDARGILSRMGDTHEHQSKDLIEREKELDAVYTLASVLTDPDIPQTQMIDSCAAILVSALQWPENSKIYIITSQHTAEAGNCGLEDEVYSCFHDYGNSLPLHIRCLCSTVLLERERRLLDSASLLIANALKTRLIRRQLEHKQIALREVLAQIEENRGESAKQMSSQIVSDIIPFVRQLLHSGSLTQRERTLADHMLRTLLNMDQKSGTSMNMGSLTPRQKEVCSLIRAGMSTKEISDMLCISDQTVERHRNTIRKRLGLIGTKTTLSEYLRT